METNNTLKKLNESVTSVLIAENADGFDKAYLVANAISELKKLLNTEYMKPIMELQGNKLGFKTDKDKDGGYPEIVVKNCVIEAVLMGVQVVGNQFNIIAGNSYITKEGYGFLLKNLEGLKYEIIPMLPRIDASKGSAAVVMKMKWNYRGEQGEKEVDFAIKVNNFMGTDAVIGKATRKARKWLYDTITGTETPDGDIEDIGYANEMKSKSNALLETEEEKIDVKTETNASHTDAVSNDAGKLNTEVQDKEKGKAGKKKDNELPLS